MPRIAISALSHRSPTTGWTRATLGSLLAVLVLVAGCVPDLGEAVPVVTDDGDLTADSASPDTNEPDDTVVEDTAQPDTSDVPDALDGDTGGDQTADGDVTLPPICDDTPASTTVDIYVWADSNTFFFTPPHQEGDQRRLHVPVNAMVRFQLATSLTERAHDFGIALPGCELESSMGVEGAEVEVEWKSPFEPGTYDAGYSPSDSEMTFQIVVAP